MSDVKVEDDMPLKSSGEKQVQDEEEFPLPDGISHDKIIMLLYV